MNVCRCSTDFVGTKWHFQPINLEANDLKMWPWTSQNTLPETNMLAPKNEWSEYYFPIGFRHIFRGYVSFFLGGGRYHIIGLENIRYSSETWPLATRILDHQLRDATGGSSILWGIPIGWPHLGSYAIYIAALVHIQHLSRCISYWKGDGFPACHVSLLEGTVCCSIPQGFQQRNWLSDMES